MTESGYGSLSAQEQEEPFEQDLSPTGADHRYPPHQGEYLFPAGANPDEFMAGMGSQLADPFSGRNDRDSVIHGSSGLFGHGVSMATGFNFHHQPMDSVIHTPATDSKSTPRILLNGCEPMISPSQRMGTVQNNEQWHEESKGPPRKRSRTASNADTSAKPLEGRFPCPHPGCEKTKKRECDLKYVNRS
jgi:hypothetical protein